MCNLFNYAECYFRLNQCFKVPSFLLSTLLFEPEQGHKMQLVVDQLDRNSEMIEILVGKNVKVHSILLSTKNSNEMIFVNVPLRMHCKNGVTTKQICINANIAEKVQPCYIQI